MALDDVYAALRDAIHDGAIDVAVTARDQAALSSLRPVLSKLRLDTTLPVGNATVTSGTAIVLTGTTSYGLPDALFRSAVEVTMTVSAASATTEHVCISLAFTDADWTLGSLFPAIGDTQRRTDLGLQFVRSPLAELRLLTPVLSACTGAEPARLSGALPADGEFAAYETLFGPWPLQLSGDVELPESANAAPAFTLIAPSPVTAFSAGTMTLSDFRVELFAINDIDPLLLRRSSISGASVGARLTAGSISSDVTVPLFSGSRVWRLRAEFERGEYPVTGGLDAIASFLGVSNDVLSMPEQFPGFETMSLGAITFDIPPLIGVDTATPPLTVGITLLSDAEWTPAVPFVRLHDISVLWTVGVTSSEPLIETTISAYLPIAGTFEIHVEALLPDFFMSGQLAQNEVIPVETLLRRFFGAGSGPPHDGMAVTELALAARPAEQTFISTGRIVTNGEEGWTVDLGPVAIGLRSVGFEMRVAQGLVEGTISGDFTIETGPQTADFAVSAKYPGAATGEGWTFRGEMLEGSDFSLSALVSRFLAIEHSSDLPDLILRDLTLEFTTGTKRYALDGVIDGRWSPELFGTEVKISAEARVSVVREPGQPPSGTLAAEFLVNKVRVKVAVALGAARATQLFEVQFGENFVQAVTSWRGDHQVLSVRLGGVTLGEVLTFLANLAAPTIGYRLDPPWDELNNIELSNFLFTVDPTEKTVEVTYDAKVKLAVMEIDSIGVRYRRVRGKHVVEPILTGRLGTKTYTSDKPLSWDAISDPPPSVGGGGSKLLDVRYIGFGQHVTRAGGFTANTVRGTLDQLAADLRPPKNPELPPLFPGNGGEAIRYAPESEWLIGFDLTLIDTVSLGIIFNDPYLYGLAVGLQGPRAGSLKGLKFEILYKKVTNDIGVFRVELQMPEAFRQIEMGAVTLTLGTVAVEIFTNGDFSVDLGFPWNRNFSRSFSVQLFPFIGRGGLYFAKLDGDTSSRVPAIANGTFSPVLQFGIGLAVGVGKEVVRGPLSGGVSVQIEVILEGVVAWFNPSSSGTPPAQYYRVEGTVAIHGRLYGVIDFEIIRISVNVEAYASATVILESYRATVLQISAGVTVYAEVDILDLFTVSFSFSASIDASFTVGSDQPTPWILGTPSAGTTPLRALAAAAPVPAAPSAMAPVPHRRERALRSTRMREGASAQRAAAAEPPWDPSRLVFDAPKTLALSLVPLFSIAGVPVSWTSTAPSNPAPRHRAAFLLLAPAAGGAASARNTLIEALLRWSLSSVTTQTVVTSEELATLAEAMKSAETRAAFSAASLATFFGANAPLVLSEAPAPEPGEQPDAMVFPVPPPLAWTSNAGDRDFAAFNRVGPLYEWGVRRYLARFFPDIAAPGAPPDDDPQSYESFASFVLRDFCLMVATSAVQAARDEMRTWTVTLAEAASPEDVADRFPVVRVSYFVRSGDTLASVAAELGATPAELLYLNPAITGDLAAAQAGTGLSIALGVSPQSVGVDNAALALPDGLSFPIGTVDVQVGDADTLQSIATRFGLSGATALLADERLAFDADVLQGGSVFTMPALAYENATFSRTRAAAVFFVHYTVPTDVPLSGWYAQTIFDLNAGVLPQFDAPLPAGLPLAVPVAYGDTTAAAEPYVTVPGDTIPRIGAALALEQNFATGDGAGAAWAVFHDAVTGTAPTFAIPSASVTVLPRDSFATLADRTIVYGGDVAALVARLASADVLAPLAVIHVPNIEAETGESDGRTLTAIASTFGIAVADLASRIASVEIFPAGTTLTIARLLVQSVDDLVSRVMAGEAPSQISGSCSRFMLAGLRLPAPLVDDDGHAVAEGTLTSLYDLTGQQVDRPPDASDPSAPSLTVTVTADPAQPWVTVAGGSLVLDYTAAELDAYEPAEALAVPPARALAPLKLAVRTPRTYGLERRVQLQSTTLLPIPFPTLPGVGSGRSGLATLWPFGDGLLELARNGNPTAYDIVVTEGGKQKNVKEVAFATLIPFKVRRAADLDGVYELAGIDPEWRQDLLRVWQSIEARDEVRKYLLAPAPASSAESSGLTVLTYAEPATFLVKTNLAGGVSTNKVPEGGAASFASQTDFLQLLWEGSVVGGSGYTLVLPRGRQLPSSVFASSGDAVLQLLVLKGSRRGKPSEALELQSYHNCVLVQRGAIEPATTALYVQEGGRDPDTIAVATVPPGNVGFTFTIDRAPRPTGQTDPELARVARLRQLFSLATWDVPGEDDAPGLPVGPQADDNKGYTLEERARYRRWSEAGRTDAPQPGAFDRYWKYDQVVPVSRFAAESSAPDGAALPSRERDPYRGIGGGTRQTVTFGIGFSDVLGNVTSPETNIPVTTELAYTDTLVPVSGWPSTTASYRVSRAAGNVVIDVTLAPQSAALLPSPADAPAAIRDAVLKQASAWTAIYYQLSQPGVSVSILNTLKTPIAQPALQPLWQFATASFVSATAAAAVQPVFGDGTLADVVSRYGVTFEALATANAGVLMASVFVDEPAVPAYAIFADGETADEIVAADRPGWPQLADGATLLAFLENADELPLRPGAVLLANERTLSTEGGSLAGAATLLRTTPALLAADNATARGILRAGAVLVYDEVEVIVGETGTPVGELVNTIDDALRVFGTVGVEVTAEDLGFALANEDLLAPFAVLRSVHFTAADGETLADVSAASETGVAELAVRNASAENLYDAGALLFLGYFDSEFITVDPLESLLQFANRYATPPGPLLAANAERELAGSALVVPGTVTLPADVSTLAVPYTALAGDTLASVAAKFGVSGESLAAANANMPGALADGQPVAGALLVAPPALITGDGPQTLAAVAARYGVTAAAFAQANAAVLGVLAAGVPVDVRGMTLTTGTGDTFNSLTTRLAPLNVEISVDELANALADATCIASGARALLPPTPVTLRASLGTSVVLAEPVMPLEVTVRIARPASVIHTDFADTETVRIADAVVPAPSAKDEESLALGAFIAELQTAIPTLRVASGRTADVDNDLWVVDFSASRIGSVVIEPPVTAQGVKIPRYFALRPLYAELVRRSAVPIAPIDETGALAAAVETDFQNVDVEVWAQRFLADFDLFLTDPYVAAMTYDAATRAALESAIDAKTKLVRAVPRALGPILAGVSDPDSKGRGLDAAQEELQEQLGTSLAQAYAIAAVVQYDAAVNVVTTEKAMRLGGTATLAARANPDDTPYTLTGAKTSLESGHRPDDANPVTFFLRVPQAKLDRAVTINFSYDVLDLEFNIADVPDTRGYQSSDFVVFTRPLDAATRPAALQPRIGPATVPIPLRNFPMPPTLLGHTASPAFKGKRPPLEQAALWTYSVAYAHEHAAQDEVIVTATFNIPPADETALRALAATTDLASELAQYAAVADPLWALLTKSIDADAPFPAAAPSTFAQLANRVATAWQQHTFASAAPASFAKALSAGGPVQETYTYRVRIIVAFDPEGTPYYDRLDLQADGEIGPDGRWPEVIYEGENGVRIALANLGDGTYSFPAEPDARQPIASTPRITLEWRALPLTHYQNANAELFVRRNAGLLPGIATHPAFVYTTAKVEAPDVLTPLLTWTDTIEFGDEAATIEDALSGLFGSLFGTTLGIPLTIEALYGYELIPPSAVSSDGVVIDVPVTLYPNRPLAAETPAALANALAEWSEETHPVSDGARWVFTLTMFSQLDAISSRPLLILNRLSGVVPVAVPV